MSAIWPWPQRVVASRGVSPNPACAGAWQALVKSCVLCWVSPPPGKSQCGAVGLSRPHTAAGHHMRGASSSGITEPREPGEEAGAPAPWPFHLSPASLPLSSLLLWPRSLFLRCLCSLCTWPLFPAFPPALPTAPGCAACLCTAPVTPSSWTLCFYPPTPSCVLPPSCTGVLPPCQMCPSIIFFLSPKPPFAMGKGEEQHKVRPRCSPSVSKKLFPLSPPVLVSLPGCFQAHILPWLSCAVTARHPLVSSVSLISNVLGMLVDPIHTVARVGHSL